MNKMHFPFFKPFVIFRRAQVVPTGGRSGQLGTPWGRSGIFPAKPWCFRPTTIHIDSLMPMVVPNHEAFIPKLGHTERQSEICPCHKPSIQPNSTTPTETQPESRTIDQNRTMPQCRVESCGDGRLCRTGAPSKRRWSRPNRTKNRQNLE